METEERKEKPPLLRHMRTLLSHAIDMIDSGEISEVDAAAMMGRFNAECRGFYDDFSLLNYDEAMRMLGIRNRNRFKELCRANRIEQVRIKNMRVGFRRTEIEDLALRMRDGGMCQ